MVQNCNTVNYRNKVIHQLEQFHIINPQQIMKNFIILLIWLNKNI